jgi:uncharacterized peroxidase-related enzyme
MDTAPQGSRPILQGLIDEVGFVPNLAAAMAESPTYVDAFTSLRSIYREGTLTPIERELVALAVAVESACDYCVAAHSTFATMHGAPQPALDALRTGETPEDRRLAALSTLARQVVRQRGQVSQAEVSAFLDAGFTPAQLLEALVGIAMTTLSSQMFHLAQTPIDDVFRAQAWHRPLAPALAKVS